MCGICGWVAGAPEPDGARVVRAMADAVNHRGPDGHGFFEVVADGTPGWLGHRRLKIIDITHAAHQPMLSEGGHALVFNGEIYNFRELRRDLRARGHVFRSTGDTEVVLRAFEQWGSDAVRRLDGMFALALWDEARRTLVLARDRTGKKPLFYSLDEGRLTFGSEVKALAVCPWIALAPDWSQLGSFLTFGYIPDPATAYDGIRQVEPGTLLEFDAATGALRDRRYWSALPSGPRVVPDGSVLAELRGLVAAAVRRRLVSDVPIGSLLSGGIDSSIVTALMARESDEQVRTFAVGFPEEASFDERKHARAVADHLGTRHTEFAVRPDAVALLDRLIWLHDGPFADSSAVPTYLVCAAARTQVTVVLTGDGGDEAFAGYQRFAAAALSRLLSAPVAAGLRSVLPLLPSSGSYHDPRKRLERFLGPAERPLVERYLDWVRVSDRGLVGSLLGTSEGAMGEASFLRAHEEARAAGCGPVDALILANFCTYLPGDLAVKIDRASMGCSLETRAPFLDTTLVEFTARVSARHKVGFARPKPLLRRAFGDLLPGDVWRRPKHGFGVPIDRWFRGDLGTRYADEVLSGSGRLAAVLASSELRRLWSDHQAGRADHGPRLWTLLTMERWLRDLAGGKPLREPPAPHVAVEAR